MGTAEAVLADLHVEQPDLVVVAVVVHGGEHGTAAAAEHDQAVVDRVEGEVHAPLGRKRDVEFVPRCCRARSAASPARP